MKFYFKFLFFIFGLISAVDSKASHIIGGDLIYECVSPGTYAVTITLYKDCNFSFELPDSVDLESFNAITHASTGSSTGYLELITNIDFSSSDPCVELPVDICVEKATYTSIISLPSSLDGYLLAVEECCLASTVSNVDLTVGSTGILVSATIPPLGGGNPTCFDSPVFNTDPHPNLCLYESLSLDFGAHLPNPDPTITLVHSFYHPEYELTLSPPFDLITFETPYTATEPVSTVSGLNIDPNTGLVTGIIDELGYFYIGIKVFAIKNGDTIATINRPFRYAVTDCNLNTSVPTESASNPIECGVLEVEFDNLSFGADTYLWIFGDSTTGVQDTSNLFEPTHTFSGFGSYEVTLITIANNNLGCADTTILPITLESAIESTIDVNNDYQCIAANNFNFQAVTTGSNVTYEWDFGPTASITTSTSGSVNNVTYTQTGIYPITLKTTFKECVSETMINVEVFDGLLSEITGPTEGCAPFDAVFKPSITKPGYTYTWRTNKQQKISENGEFTYHNPGVYSLELYVVDADGCESSHYIDDYIEIFEVPETGFTIADYKISAGDLVEVENEVEGDYKIEFLINTTPEIKEVVTKSNFGFTIYKEGDYFVTQTVTNNDICVSQETQIVNVGPPRVNPPNVFTPNKDGVNDYYFIEPYNNSNIELRIFDRWGMEIYSSENYELCDTETGDFCWDGTDRNGNECIPGIYMYTINLSNGFVKQGVLNLF